MTVGPIDQYLALERKMLAADQHDQRVAEALRDTMDALWYRLTDDQHAVLNDRAAYGSLDIVPALGA